MVALPGEGPRDPRPLIAFRFGTAAAAEEFAPATLALERAAEREDWLAPGPVTRHRDGNVELTFSPAYATARTSIDLPSHGSLAAATGNAYRKALRLLFDAGFPVLVRTWNFIPGINTGEGDAERYRQFCLGRGSALDALGVEEAALPAGTAVGVPESAPLTLALLAGNRPVVQVENPRQMSAYRYPRRYGLRSPSFARATLLGIGQASPVLLASGTASIRGHASMHEGNLEAQLRETLTNLEALISTARRLEPRLPEQLGANSVLRVYLRRAETSAAARRLLARHLPQTRVTLLQADICRRELDVELEAVLGR